MRIDSDQLLVRVNAQFKRLIDRLPANAPSLMIVVLVFGGLGVWMIAGSHASTSTASLETENGTISATSSSVVDTTASGGSAVKFGQPVISNGLPIKAAFYYPWFPEAWSQLGINPYTQYSPSLGFYSSTDATVINAHIDALQYAGMDAAIYSWWGQATKEDIRFQAFLTASHGKALKWAPYYECEGNATGGTCTSASPSSATIVSDLAYIKAHYASDPNYLHINGKPVIFVYGDATDSCTTASNWAAANAGQGFYVVLKVFSGYASCSDQPDNWHQYAPAVAEDVQSGHSIAISPGFYKADETSPRLARDLTTWQQNVTDLKNSTAPLKLVATFNEWGEGSAVESASQWSSTSGYGQYIDILHNTLVSAATDTTPPSAPTNLSITNSTVSQVSLGWTAASDNVAVAKYEITRNGTVITTLNAPATSYTDGTVSASTQYSYSVKAIDAAGNKSTASNTATTTTPQSDATAPSVPAGVTATLQSPTSNVVHVAWSASTDTGGSGLRDYLVTRNGTVVATVTAPTTTFDDSTTVYSTQYSYTVAARDNANNTSNASSPAVVTTPTLQVTDTQAPDVPTATATVISTTQVTISWTTVQDNPKTGGASGVQGYKVFRNGTQIANIAAPSTSTNDGPFSFVTDQNYSYTVLAYDASGNASAQSASSSVVPNPHVSAGGVCGNTPTGNKIDTIIVISEENRTWSDVGGTGFSATTMPYVHNIASQCAYFTQDTEVNTGDNSAQQYVGAWTGYNSTVTTVSNDCSPSASCSYTGNNIFRAFRNANVPHREYVEGATSTCSASGNAAKHIPELYMWDPTDKAACSVEVLPMSQFNFASPPTGYTFITPTLCNDGHDCTDSTVNSWLADPTRLPALFNTAQYKAGKVLLELWYDEDHPKPNLFACWSCKQVSSSTDPHYSGESLLWLNLLNTPSVNLGGISSGADIRSIIGTP
jgi:hypothetical protein